MRKTDNFFGEHGNKIFLKNKTDFYKKFDELDCSVSRKSHNNDETERWIIHKVFSILYLHDLMPDNISLEKSEQPDFKVNHKQIISGIEIVRAVDPQYMQAKDHAQKTTDGYYPIDSFFQFGNKMKPKMMDKTFQDPKQSLRGAPWYGNQGLLETIKWLKFRINKKLVLLNSQPFQEIENVELVIYIYLPSSIHTDINELVDKIGSNSYQRFLHFKKHFSKIHILKNTSLITNAFSNEVSLLNGDQFFK